MSGDFDDDAGRRDLQIEAAAHVRVQAEIDRLYAEGALPDPVSVPFLTGLHEAFYADASEAMLLITAHHHSFTMAPGRFRDRPEHDVEVGRHVPPSSERVAAFMDRFAERYAFETLSPFPDGNGRVSRLMSHAMIQNAGIGAHGLWSVSRGLARGLDSRQ